MKAMLQFCNLIAVVALLLSCMAAYIDPRLFWQLSFVGFVFPVVLLVNVAFLLLWLLLLHRFVWVPALAILLSWNFTSSVVAFHLSLPTEKAQGLKLMTWNVKNFDLYHWSNNLETRGQMMALIRRENPDVLCLQEFYTNNQQFRNREYLRDTLGYTYSYFSPAVALEKKVRRKLAATEWNNAKLVQEWGVAIFSKYPLTDTGVVHFDNSLGNGCIYADIRWGKELLRVYNVHYQSLHLGDEDYVTLNALEEEQNMPWWAVKGILRKMKRAYLKRAVQVAAVRENMDSYEGTKLLCGDFNDVPVSYAYHKTRGAMDDAFLEKGKGFGGTFVQKISLLRIDYILHDPVLRANSYKVIPQKLSDHYPVVATLSVR